MTFSFQILKNSLVDFISYWADKYNYPKDYLYDNNIGKPITERSLMELFEWKNGTPISEKKTESIRRNYPVRFTGDPVARYLSEDQPGGPIWNIFYLHCLDHHRWPIYDQHTYRAMMYLQTGIIQEIPASKHEKYSIYRRDYIPFLQSLPQKDLRKADKALFAFGQFLKAVKPYVDLKHPAKG